MSNTRPLSEYSRQELYDLIWSTPAIKLATEFGISDVAIAKRCRHRNIPRPGLGYWAKVAAGQRLRKTPLPPTPDELFKKAVERRIAKPLSLPATTEPLLPLATELMTAISKAKLDDHKRTRLVEPSLPRVTVSRNLGERVGRAFHVLLKQLEPCGILFRKYQGSYEGGYFRRHNDRLSLAIEEDITRPDGTTLGTSSWQPPQHGEKPSGRMTFSVKFVLNGYYKNKEWSESAKVSLEQTLSQVVDGIRKHYLDLHEQREREKIESAKRHAEWLEREREREKQEAIRLQREKEQKHAAALAAVPQARKSALLKAANNWHLSRIELQFIDECEARWKNQSGALTAEQNAWLAWAREIATATSPFSAGYPDPQSDGAFDPTSVPVGGHPSRRRAFFDDAKGFNCLVS
jgi:hypothetical protein